MSPKKQNLSAQQKKAPRVAVRFKATRKHHSDEAAEDYTELVAKLISEKGVARTCDIAEHLGISHVTALRTIRRLVSEGYLKTTPRHPVTLTQKGTKLASVSKDRHETMLELFSLLGIPDAVAEIDVEGIEHHISQTSLIKIKTFLKKHKDNK